MALFCGFIIWAQKVGRNWPKQGHWRHFHQTFGVIRLSQKLDQMNNPQMNLKKWVMVHKITTTKKKKFVWYKTTHFLGRLFIWPQSWTKRINPKHNQYFGVIHLTQLFRSNEYPKKIFQIDQIGVISVNFDPPFFSFIWPIKLLETNNPQNKPNVFHDFFRFLFLFSFRGRGLFISPKKLNETDPHVGWPPLNPQLGSFWPNRFESGPCKKINLLAAQL